MRVRYYGHVGLLTGYGIAASENCMALLLAGVDLEISTDGKELPARYLPLARCIRGSEHLTPYPDVVIVHTLPLDCARVLGAISVAERLALVAIAYTTWEGASAPPESIFRSLMGFDAVWVPSTHNLDRLVDRERPVFAVPHPFDEDEEFAASRPEARPVYRFYYIGAWTRHKNPEGVIQAYIRAFLPSDPVELVIHSYRAKPDACQRAQLATGIMPDDMPQIRFSHDRLTDDGIRALHQACDCFVTASRGEAWNLPAFDALRAGRHIIAPEHLGSDDFLEGTSAWMYRSTQAPAGGGIVDIAGRVAPPGHAAVVYIGTQALTVRGDWREPDISELALLMRRAVHADVRVQSSPPNLADRFGRRAVGRRMLSILNDLRAQKRAR